MTTFIVVHNFFFTIFKRPIRENKSIKVTVSYGKDFYRIRHRDPSKWKIAKIYLISIQKERPISGMFF